MALDSRLATLFLTSLTAAAIAVRAGVRLGDGTTGLVAASGAPPVAGPHRSPKISVSFLLAFLLAASSPGGGAA